jgi:hypothetical protein
VSAVLLSLSFFSSRWSLYRFYNAGTVDSSSLFHSFLLSIFALPVDCLAKKASASATAASTAAASTGGLSTATDGPTILDKTATIKYAFQSISQSNPPLTQITSGLSIRYKISAPASQFTASSGVTGASTTTNSTGTAGLNVLLHSDGGQSFFDFPNQAMQNNLMGVVILAPNKNLFWGSGSGLQRTDGVAHTAAVNTLIQTSSGKMLLSILQMYSLLVCQVARFYCLGFLCLRSEHSIRRVWC